MSLVRKNFDLEGVSFDCCALVTTDNKLYCKLKELAELLGYNKPSNSFALIDDKWKFTWSQLAEREGMSPPARSNWQPTTIFVSEPGIYSLVLRSRKPEAVRFRDHVLEVVLPEIRRTGAYVSPDVTASQAEGIIEALREQQAEKDRMLEETRAAVAERDRLLEETRTVVAERDRMLEESRGTLEETRGAVAEKDRILSETQAAVTEKDRILNETQVMLGNEMRQRNRLQSDLQTVRPKVAVIPDRDTVRHTLSIYQRENTYKFIRTQKRNLEIARRRIPEGFRLVYYIDDTPNALNIVNRLREILPRNVFRSYNTIATDEDVVQLVQQILQNEFNRPITPHPHALNH